jgi:hypothetical protein
MLSGARVLWDCSMTEAENLHRQAKRALRLASGILDEQAARALNAHAADLHQQAAWLERQDMPPIKKQE